MGLLEDLAEERIRTAMAQGDFDDLPGQGRPLALDDDALVPAEMRLAYRVLKNAGYIPEELELRREIADVEAILARTLEGDDRHVVSRRLTLLRLRLAARTGERPVHLEADYEARIRRRLGAEPGQA